MGARGWPTPNQGCYGTHHNRALLRVFIAAMFVIGTPCYSDPAAAVPPPRFVSLCIQMPSMCRRVDPESAPLSMTKFILATNERVNDGIVPTPNTQSVQRGFNSWEVVAPGAAGDCEQYAITKRLLLLWLGVPAGAMRIAIVHRASSPLSLNHAVLLVRIGRVEFVVLDNLTDVAWPADAVQYDWIEVEKPGDPWMWIALNGAPT